MVEKPLSGLPAPFALSCLALRPKKQASDSTRLPISEHWTLGLSPKWLWLKKPVPKWNLGKWNGSKPAVCPSCLVLSHSQICDVRRSDGSSGARHGALKAEKFPTLGLDVPRNTPRSCPFRDPHIVSYKPGVLSKASCCYINMLG